MKINIIIPTTSRTSYVCDDLVRSINEQSVFKHNIMVMPDIGNKYPQDTTAYYIKVEEAVEKTNSGPLLITNDDMIFGYKWDEALLNCQKATDADVTTMANICNLSYCGWQNPEQANLKEHGAEQPSWVSMHQTKELYTQFQEYSKVKRAELRDAWVYGSHWIPFLIKKETFYKVLNGKSYRNTCDINFFKQCRDMELKLVIACDSLCYHYVRLSDRI